MSTVDREHLDRVRSDVAEMIAGELGAVFSPYESRCVAEWFLGDSQDYFARNPIRRQAARSKQSSLELLKMLGELAAVAKLDCTQVECMLLGSKFELLTKWATHPSAK